MSAEQGEPRWLVTIKGADGRLYTYSCTADQVAELQDEPPGGEWKIVEVRPDPDGPPRPE